MTFEHFHSSGKIPVLIEQLKITVRDSDRRSGQQRRSLADILSRPVALDFFVSCLYRYQALQNMHYILELHKAKLSNANFWY